ncbi:MAG: AAA family ATPase [Eubacterium sp.]
MRINTLKLENFQGIKSLEVSPYGENIEIRGDNATGKTTIGNAITWLLYGKPLDGAKNFNPKPKDKDGSDAHFLDTTVEMTLDIAGIVVTLKKVYKENWSKTKGSPEKEFKGNVTECFIDSVPTTATKFQERVDSICAPDWVRILTSPFYFAEDLPWQERRGKLLEMCGNMSDADVIAAVPELQALTTLLQMPGNDTVYNIDDYVAMKKAEMKKINAELQGIGPRVDEATKAMPDVSGLTKKALNAELKEAREQKAELERKRGALSESTIKSQTETEINRLTMEQARARAAFEGEANTKVRKAQNEKGTLEKKLRNLNEMCLTENAFLNTQNNTLEMMTKARKALLEEYSEVSAENYTGSDTCPTCGQALLPEKLQAAQANWNEQKSKRLEAINLRGKQECGKEKIADTKGQIEQIRAKLTKIDAEISELDISIKAVVVPELLTFESTETYQSLQIQIDGLKEKIAVGSTDIVAAEKPIRDAITAVEGIIQEKEHALLNVGIAEGQKARIKELEQREKDLAEAYEQAEKALYLCEQFIQEKARRLTDSINNRFETVRFRLFDTQINGGIKECCDVLVTGKDGLVPFNTANNAGKVNAGIELINAFSDHTGYHVPLVIDNAESVVKLLPAVNQMFKLVVDETAKILEIKEHVK